MSHYKFTYSIRNSIFHIFSATFSAKIRLPFSASLKQCVLSSNQHDKLISHRPPTALLTIAQTFWYKMHKHVHFSLVRKEYGSAHTHTNAFQVADWILNCQIKRNGLDSREIKSSQWPKLSWVHAPNNDSNKSCRQFLFDVFFTRQI